MPSLPGSSPPAPPERSKRASAPLASSSVTPSTTASAWRHWLARLRQPVAGLGWGEEGALGGLLGGVLAAPGSDADDLASSTDLSLVTRQRIERDLLRRQVPPALVAAFAPAALAAGDPLFVGRAALLERVAAAITGWQQGRPMLLALTGPRGCGLTSLLNQVAALPALCPAATRAASTGAASTATAPPLVVRQTLGERPADLAATLRWCAACFALPTPPESLAAAVTAINALPPRLLLVDNGHFLYSRVMGGSEGVLAFGSLMVATQERHMWLLACEEQAWRRQCHANQASRYYDEVLTLDYFSREELGELFARRLAQSGVGRAPPQAADGSQAVDGSQAAAGALRFALDERETRLLHRLSGGHPELAFFHLLRALEIERASDMTDDTTGDAAGGWQCGALTELDYSALRELDRTELLTLAEISTHGRLSANEHQQIFRLGERSSQIVLEHLRQLSLIECGGGQYRLEPLHADAINAHLLRANFLY